MKKEEDPIQFVRARILENAWATEQELEAIEEKSKMFVEECEEFAENSPFPDPEKMYEYVYSEPNYPFLDKLEN